MRHKGNVAVELEVLAKKFDRFGWDRDRETPAQDRMIQDWIEALCDYPLDEVKAACRAAVMANPNKMPNEGHIYAQIIKARRIAVASIPKPVEPSAPRVVDAEQKARADDMVAQFTRRART